MNTVTQPIRLALLSLFAITTCSAASENQSIFGLSVGHIHSNGSACEVTPPFSDCETGKESIRLMYEFQTDNKRRFQFGLTFADIRFTNKSDPIFNDPTVSSEITDVSVLFLGHQSQRLQLHYKLGLAYWYESRSSTFLSSDSDSGLVPVLGVDIDFGQSKLKLGAHIDVYPAVEDADIVTFAGVSLRYYW